MSKPREFWISFGDDHSPFVSGCEQDNVDSCLHVIEKSAYDSVVAENKQLKASITALKIALKVNGKMCRNEDET